MSVTPDFSTAAPAPDLAAEIARVRASGVLGASGRLVELFEFLVACSLEGRSPKEAEIALAVFGKADAEALRDDPVARVYIHRLRKRFDEFYLRNGTTNGARLDIPKGDYRIVCVSPADVATPDLTEPQPDAAIAPLPANKRWRWGLVAAALLVLAAGNVAAWAMLGGNTNHANAVELSTPWRPMAEGTRPLRARLATCAPGASLCVLSGPEGGLSPAELAAAAAAGFQATTLGPRVLRADTAPLAVLASVATLETPE